ncbi:MAG: hypothetical protein IPI14_11910 [Polaromonas sp.]|nr:hypothetical protein [Polaromonas sp.]
MTIDDAIAGEGNETINGTISAVTGGNGATIATPARLAPSATTKAYRR